MQGRGGRLGGRSGGGRGRSGGSGRFQRDEGPPDEVVEVGHFMHECENEMVYKLIEKDGKVPYFNAGVYLQNKKKLGKVDEVRISGSSSQFLRRFFIPIFFISYLL